MRIDKYLKLSRLVKRRAQAQEMISIGAVRLNGREVKPSTLVHEQDNIEIAYTARVLSLRVTEDDEKNLRRGIENAYILLEEKRVDPERKPW
ncbi:MAG: RNA-binding S4 domain-containing protein [Synergistales bacterium]|nr:RNA-binding S4 domain-containing protein [Synergistales bacterium]